MFHLETPKARAWRYFKNVLPVLFLALVVVCFAVSVSIASESSISNQQESLEHALRGAAVRTYALTGCYPESLDELLEAYRITYDSRKFIVEYTPSASNLFPTIFVLQRNDYKN